MTIETEATMKKNIMVSTCTTFCIEVPYHLAYEIFTFTAQCQILTGPSQLTLILKRNVRYLEKGQARGMLTILASLFCITLVDEHAFPPTEFNCCRFGERYSTITHVK